MGNAVLRDTLFIHGSSGGGGGAANAIILAKERESVVASDCTSACGSADTHGISGMSTFCDPSCLPGWSLAGPRFDGHGCGSNDPSRFGESCRQCYNSQAEALAEEQRLPSPEIMGSVPGVHVVMCSTGSPPPASECSDECMSTVDAVRLWSFGFFQVRCSAFCLFCIGATVAFLTRSREQRSVRHARQFERVSLPSACLHSCTTR